MHWLALLALPTVFAQGTGTEVPWDEAPATATEGTTATAGPTPTGGPGLQAVAKVNEAAGLLSNASIENARRALTLLGEASDLDPEQAWAWYNKGVAHKILNEDSKARQSWLRATDIDPTLGDAWLQMGLMSLEDGELKRGLTSFRAGLRSDEDNMDLRVALVSVLRELGRLEDAEQAAKEGLRINANWLDLYHVLGVVYIEMGKLPLAEFILDKAVRDVSGGAEHAGIQTNLGRVLELQGYEYDASLKYQESLRLDPDSVAALVYLSTGYMENRNYADAVPLLERARGLANEDPSIHLNLGVAYRGVGRFEESQKSYEETLRLRPSDPSPHLNLGILFGDYVKDYQSAVDAYQAYLDQGGEDVELVEGYIKATKKEQKKVKRLEERRKKADSDRKAKEERERLVKEEEERKETEAAQPPAASEGAGEETVAPGPTPEAAAEEPPVEEAPEPAAEEPPVEEAPEPAAEEPAATPEPATPEEAPIPAEEPPEEEVPDEEEEEESESTNPWGI